MATSSRLRRTWRHAGRASHHLIDPATGQPSNAHFATATVVAGTAWRAEVLAKATILSASIADAERMLHESNAAALLTDADGRFHRLGGIERFLDPITQKGAS